VPAAIEELKHGGHFGSADPEDYRAQLRWLIAEAP
jgi:hypothetical protein